MSDSEDLIDLPDEVGDDLFGDGDDDVEVPSDDGARALSDVDQASDGDADERYQRDDVDMDGQQVKNLVVMDIPIYRHRTPKTADGSLRSLRTPTFLKVAAEEYVPDTFQPTPWDRENVKDDNPKSVIRHQKDPATGKLMSNTAIYRWSDGSLTLAVGNEHYEISKKQMIPPSDKPYQERLDSHYYAAAAHLASGLLMTVGHVAEQFTVLPNRNMQDDALAQFATRMAAASRSKQKEGDHIFTATKDPEMQRKEAELAEKERMKAQRRRENAAARNDSRVGTYRSGGLSIGDLEGGRRAPGGARKRGQPGGQRPKKRRPEYDSDDDLPAGRGRNDEYDRDDGFIAPSDEDDEDAEEDDDLLDDDDDFEEEKPRSKRQKTAEADDADADADGDADGDAPATGAETSRGRRRNIVDDDDDDE